jgi:ParB-like chromosome segregation protein Spo0J
MIIRDRIKELRRVRADQLKPHPHNWRTHPPAQQDALRGMLAEVGYADALLAREMPDGSLQLIDGHLRAETTPDVEMPVLIVDLDDQETAKLLALHDPLAVMAQTDRHTLATLVENIQTESEAIEQMLEKILDEPQLPPHDDPEAPTCPREVDVPEAYQVVVECQDEAQQQTVYQRMTAEGFKCRLLML